MKALITGGSGYLGSRIAQMLRARGDDVVILGRNIYPQHNEAGIRAIRADLRDATAIEKACEGIDAVFHVGALVGIWGRRKTYWDINVNGTKNVLNGCRVHGVRQLVYTSSASVVFDENALCGVDESQPYATRYLANYPETKAVAERMILAANGPTLATVALRPHLIWGPGDPHLIPRVIERARHGRLVQVGDGENLVDITYVDNAAEAHLRAAEALAAAASCAGRAYFLSQGEPVPLWPWLNEILAAVGIPKVTQTVSYRRAYRVGAMLEGVHRLVPTVREPRMTRFLAVQLAKSHYFDISASRRDLGYHPRISTAEGVHCLLKSLGASCGRNFSSASGLG